MQDGDTALYRASIWGHMEVVAVLLAAGVDVNASSKVSAVEDGCAHVSLIG